MTVLTIILVVLIMIIAVVFWRYKRQNASWQQELLHLNQFEDDDEIQADLRRAELLEIFGREPELTVSEETEPKQSSETLITDNIDLTESVEISFLHPEQEEKMKAQESVDLKKQTRQKQDNSVDLPTQMDTEQPENFETEAMDLPEAVLEQETKNTHEAVLSRIKLPSFNKEAMLATVKNKMHGIQTSIQEWQQNKELQRQETLEKAEQAAKERIAQEALEQIIFDKMQQHAQDEQEVAISEPHACDETQNHKEAISKLEPSMKQPETESAHSSNTVFMADKQAKPEDDYQHNDAKKNHEPRADLAIVQLNMEGIKPIQLEGGADEVPTDLKEVEVNWAPIQRIDTDTKAKVFEEVKLNMAAIKPLPEPESVIVPERETIVVNIPTPAARPQKPLEVIDIPDYFKNRARRLLEKEEIIELAEQKMHYSADDKQALPHHELVINNDNIRSNLMRQKISRQRQTPESPISNTPSLKVIQEDEVIANLAKTDSPINRIKGNQRAPRVVVRDSIIPATARIDTAHALKLDADENQVNDSAALFTRFTPYPTKTVVNTPTATLTNTVREDDEIELDLDLVNALTPLPSLDDLIPLPADTRTLNIATDHVLDEVALMPTHESKKFDNTMATEMPSFDAFDYSPPELEMVYEPEDWQQLPKVATEEVAPMLLNTLPAGIAGKKVMDVTELDSSRALSSGIKTHQEWEEEFTRLSNEHIEANPALKNVLSQAHPAKNSASSLLTSFLAPTKEPVPETPAQSVPVTANVERIDHFVQEPIVTEDTWQLPSLELLQPASTDTSMRPSDDLLIENGITIEEKLSEFKVKVNVVDAYAGPVITRYEIEPDVGVRGSQVVNLEKDLARALGFSSIRVVETIPGKTCMGLELPNPKRQMIRVSEIFKDPVFLDSKSKLTMALGQDISGQPIVADLAKAPHLLVAGTTGSGKSVGVNAMILSMLFKASPEEVRMIMIDPKMLELSIYEGIPHLLAPVVTDMKLAANALNWCVNEMEKRYRLMSHMGVRNLAGFNQKIMDAHRKGERIGNPFSLTPENPEPLEKLPFIVVVVDEFADLMMTAGKKIEELIARLAQKARAAGIHLILATQRPSVDVITGLIKANIPTRIAFQVSSKIDSRTILDQMGAENLLGQGDMLFLPPGTGYPQRVHGAFVADDEVHHIVEYLKSQGAPQYIDDILTINSLDDEKDSSSGSNRSSGAEDDPLFDEAVELVIRTQKASISSVQRQLRIGYNRAARLVEQMESNGLVSAPENNGNRTVLVTNSFKEE